eukprot:CAMPEP_0182450854 /NCGR_PEP_ID=MMETSP1172-20130603/43405_1 /TAXON_ID=708627 /ORGANISM="Timspurckia oligopyrenoides, Strain CCMP3278" /LENGTH=521 /DNA_ID=CAMNT_0024648577 /DNA_START=170 /DNA_END=1735 /DNA_ORIENTATION=-
MVVGFVGTGLVGRAVFHDVSIHQQDLKFASKRSSSTTIRSQFKRTCISAQFSHHQRHQSSFSSNQAAPYSSKSRHSTSASTSTKAAARSVPQQDPRWLDSLVRLLSVSISTGSLFALDAGFRQLFVLLGFTFPSALGGMISILGFLLIAKKLKPDLARFVVAWFEPGVSLLSKFLAVFFVPILVALPLAKLPGGSEALKVSAVVIGGFLTSLITTAKCAQFIASRQKVVKYSKPPREPQGPRPTGFTPELTKFWGWASAITFALSGFNLGIPVLYQAFGFSLTVFGFCYGQRLSPKIKKFIHPLISSTLVTLSGLAVFSEIFCVGFRQLLKQYLARTSAFALMGGGDLLLYVLGPSIISFAFSMYKRWGLVQENAAEIFGATLFASVLSLFGTGFVCRLLGLAPDLRLALLPRMITAPLAIEISKLIGADSALAASVVSITGLLGANFYSSIFKAFKVERASARGLATGSAAHGLGSAAILQESDAFPFAAIAMTLVGIISTTLVSIPSIRAVLLAVTLGG